MQQVVALAASQPIFLNLPAPDTEVMSNVLWGRFEDVFTPAFWAAQAWMDPSHADGNFSLGRSLAEELAACLLGGHGAPAEVGLAASNVSRLISVSTVPPYLMQQQSSFCLDRSL
ncbi:hypothetical protein EH240_21680 [Mesorhizobium tamadayense]|uniref:Uncharacterized protein n=1 Tax=Mesorhizobium tamadayense TaxID=425306 RepID=A0A3P3FE63_9HYPH|nr:hypothetical protein [Mesorhizobium tamadayense]RRH96905.1 hypothetical protein EH240_21680 [Mesorhizobium tamadayense]